MLHRSPLLSLLPLLLLPACGSEASDDGGSTGASSTGSTAAAGSSTGDDPTGAAAGPTYWQDVAPIFFASCVGCHQAGGIGPFGLDSYAEAKTWAMAAAGSRLLTNASEWRRVSDAAAADARARGALPNDRTHAGRASKPSLASAHRARLLGG